MTSPWLPRPGDRVRLHIRLAECPPCPHCGAPWASEDEIRECDGEHTVLRNLTGPTMLCPTCDKVIAHQAEGWVAITGDLPNEPDTWLSVPYTWLEPVL